MSLFRRRLMMAGSSRSVETLLISLDTNQDDDSVLIGKRITVSYGVTEKILEWKGQTISIDIPGETVCSIFFPAVDGYKTPEALSFTTVGETTKAISGMYNTEVVKVKAVFGNGGVITGQPVNINGKLVTTNLSGIATSMVPYGKMYDIVPSAKPDYDTPESIIGRTASQKEYSTTFTYIETSSRQEVVNIDLKTNQASSSDINGVNINLKYGEVNKNLTWRGSRLTEVVPEGEIYTLTFSGVKDYKTPNQQSYTAVGGNTRPVQALYETEVVEVTVSADDGAPIAGQVVTINGETHSVGSSGIVRQKVAFGISYSVSMSAKQGYTTPGLQTYTSSQALRPVTMVYRVESAKSEVININITSNQNAPLLFNGTNITLEYGGKYKYFTWNGSTISAEVQEGVPYTITTGKVKGFKTPEPFSSTAVGGYTRPVSMEYQAELLWVNVVDSQDRALIGPVISLDITGESFTSEGYPLTFYIPMGERYTVTGSSKEGYSTPKPYIDTADSKSKEISMRYEASNHVVTVKLQTTAGPGVVANRKVRVGNQLVTTNDSGIATASMPMDGRYYTVKVGDIGGYSTPSMEEGYANTPAKQIDIMYEALDKGCYFVDKNNKFINKMFWGPSRNPDLKCLMVVYEKGAAFGLAIQPEKRGSLSAYVMVPWAPGGSSSLPSLVDKYPDSNSAITTKGQGGLVNTAHILLRYVSVGGECAARLANTKKINGPGIGYLPTAFEFKKICDMGVEINECIDLVDKDYIHIEIAPFTFYWTSVVDSSAPEGTIKAWAGAFGKTGGGYALTSQPVDSTSIFTWCLVSLDKEVE